MQLQGFWQLPNNGKLSDPNSTTVNTPPKMPKGMDSNGPCFCWPFAIWWSMMIQPCSDRKTAEITMGNGKSNSFLQGESYHSSGAKLKKKLCHQEALMAQKAQTLGCFLLLQFLFSLKILREKQAMTLCIFFACSKKGNHVLMCIVGSSWNCLQKYKSNRAIWQSSPTSKYDTMFDSDHPTDLKKNKWRKGVHPATMRPQWQRLGKAVPAPSSKHCKGFSKRRLQSSLMNQPCFWCQLVGFWWCNWLELLFFLGG